MTQDPAINILIAEDNEITREMMAGLLRAQGYGVIGAIDGDSAIKVVEEHNLSLALVDLNMAPRGGFDFVKYLLVNNIDLPVVIITADDSSDLLMAARDLGVLRVLHKPVEPERLIEVVRRVLKRRGITPKPLAVDTHETSFTPEQLMQHAIDLADRNAKSKKGGPFGAVVADSQGRILGEGANRISSRIDPTAHAEVMAIRQAAEKLGRSDLKDCVLYCSSAPTMMGHALILSVGISKVYYALSHEDTQAVRHHEQSEVASEQIGRESALKMFRRWEELDEKLHD